jgi:S-DNA-T family DNA segregation ATPase FtsK/SpoIIIE
MAGKRDPKASRRGVKEEVAGIAIVSLALYAAVSIYSPAGPSNWGGWVGERLSSALFRVLGYTSFILPAILAALSLEFLLRRRSGFRPSVLAAFPALIVSLAGLLSIALPARGAGGAAGEMLGVMLGDLFGASGAAILLMAAVLISALFATGISLLRAAISLAARAGALSSRVAGAARTGGKDAPSAARAARDDDEDAETSYDGVRVEDKGAAKDPPAIIQPRAPEAAPAHLAATQPPKIHAAAEDAPGRDAKERLEFAAPKGTFLLPPLSLLDPVPSKASSVDDKLLLENSKVLERKLMDFGVEGRVLEVRPGPVVTMYEFEPAPGIKVGRITNLSDDLALAMKAMSIRIIAPIPGKSVVGIEVPNEKKDLIRLREMMECPAFTKSRSRLSLALGKDISGSPYVADLARMPHILLAGATGTGKSVSVNAMILSILYKATPEDARFLMVDPKMLELSAYEGIPHLISPVITDPKRAASALRGIVTEMGRRYKLMAEKGSRNIEKYNQQLADEPADDEDEHRRLPYIVVIIDELADLMMTSGKDVEECLVRLSQMARASGIHLMIATQRPSVDVVTGLIKTNFPARIAFQLPSRTDSRTILDSGGAETLLGEGDMLFLPPGTAKLQRIHGVYISEGEIRRVTDFWKAQGGPIYEGMVLERDEREDEDDGLGEGFLKRYDEAVAMAADLEMISTSYVQRRLRVGYNTAARIIEKMEREGLVGPAQGSRPREVLRRA